MGVLIRTGLITASYLFVSQTEGMDVKTAWFLGALAIFIADEMRNNK